MLEIHERVGGPQPFAQLLARDEFTRLLEQRFENLNGLIRNLEAGRSFAELAAADVEFERSEPDLTRGHTGVVHGSYAVRVTED
jgi:hypothetical protein